MAVNLSRLRTGSPLCREIVLEAPHAKAVIHRQTRLFDDFFKIDEIQVSHEQLDGTMSAEQRRLVFERGDAVAVLLFNLDTRCVVLVRQFKVPTLIGRRRDVPSTSDGWITEAMAGMIRMRTRRRKRPRSARRWRRPATRSAIPG